MNSAQEIKAILSRHKTVLSKKYGVSTMGIFGSYVRGEQAHDSDIDILVEFNRPIGLQFVDLAEELERILNMRVDLVSRGSISPRMWAFVGPEVLYVLTEV